MVPHFSENAYVYNRGDDVIVALTNTRADVEVEFGFYKFKTARVYCNIFDPKYDCFRFKRGSLKLHFTNGEPKIYVRASSKYFSDLENFERKMHLREQKQDLQ